jgi:hypothetical protein
MKPEIKQRWVAALRSGKYKQGRKQLRFMDDNSFCCLGVLTDLAVQDGVCRWGARFSPPSDTPQAGNDTAPPIFTNGALDMDVQKWSGCRTASPWLGSKNPLQPPERNLIVLNDHLEYTFEQIADLIEADTYI